MDKKSCFLPWSRALEEPEFSFVYLPRALNNLNHQNRSTEVWCIARQGPALAGRHTSMQDVMHTTLARAGDGERMKRMASYPLVDHVFLRKTT